VAHPLSVHSHKTRSPYYKWAITSGFWVRISETWDTHKQVSIITFIISTHHHNHISYCHPPLSSQPSLSLVITSHYRQHHHHYLCCQYHPTLISAICIINYSITLIQLQLCTHPSICNMLIIKVDGSEWYTCQIYGIIVNSAACGLQAKYTD
jgi:hypothetical protein